MALRVQGHFQARQRLKNYADGMQRSVESIITQEARALAVEYGRATVPGPGMDDARLEKFGNRVEGDVRRVFASRSFPSAIYQIIQQRAPHLCAAYWRAVKSGKTREAAAIMKKANIPEGPPSVADLKAARTGKRARVLRGQVPVRLVREGELTAFVRKQRNLVGFSKGGWYAAAKSLGGRVRSNFTNSAGARKTAEIFPAAVRKLAGRFPGIGGSIISGGRTFAITIFSTVKHARAALKPSLEKSAESRARENIRVALRAASAKLKTRRAA